MRVLVIDDNPDHRELIIAKILKEFPAAEFEHVVRRSDLDRALNNGVPDLVLTDYRLQWTDAPTMS
jgi:CheY-like chemotaxis protein